MASRLDPRDFTDPYLQDYARVPPAGPGVCRVCHSGPGPGFPTCASCHRTTSQVSRPARLVVPITLYELQGQMWHVLRYYKDGRTETTRARFADQVAATLARFISLHRSCIEAMLGSSLTAITTVPSSGSRGGAHPLQLAVRRVASIRDLSPLTLQRGPTPVTHNAASDTGYQTVEDPTGHHVLLIDDTFTTGARSQSAASTLALAGAATVTVLAIGRVIDPTWNDACTRIWTQRHLFDFNTCCLE